MRYVGGSCLNNPATRANQSGEGGLRLEPGGSGKNCVVCLYPFKSGQRKATAWLRRASRKRGETVIMSRYGCALL